MSPELLIDILIDILIATVPLMLIFATLFAFTTWLERKALARIQNRIGPNKVGIPCTRISLFGLGQPAADGIKMIFNEDIVPRGADRLFHLLAPILALIPAMLVLCFLPLEFPWTKSLLPVQAFLLDGAVIFFFAITGLNTLAVFMAGWASRNKYSLLGGMRAVAQMVSYEIPLVLSAVIVVMMVGSLNAAEIANAQAGWNWLCSLRGASRPLSFSSSPHWRKPTARPSTSQRPRAKSLPAISPSTAASSSLSFSSPNTSPCSPSAA